MTDRASLSSWTQPLQFEDKAHWTMDLNIRASFPKESKACICRFAYIENIHHNSMDRRHNRLFHVQVLFKNQLKILVRLIQANCHRKGVTLMLWHCSKPTDHCKTSPFPQPIKMDEIKRVLQALHEI